MRKQTLMKCDDRTYQGDRTRSPDLLKALDAVCCPDPRQTSLVVPTHEERGYRQRTLADQHAAVSTITLSDRVPVDVRVCFETARNLWLYSWFVYRFIPVAEFQAFASLECALRLRLRSISVEAKNLASLLRLAVKHGLLSDIALEQTARFVVKPEPVRTQGAQEGLEQGNQRVKMLARLLPDLRNEYAHGSPSLGPGGLRSLQLCAGLINCLFDSDDSVGSAAYREA